jgi:hypothetical protein
LEGAPAGALFVYSNSGAGTIRVFDLSLASTDGAGSGGLTAVSGAVPEGSFSASG